MIVSPLLSRLFCLPFISASAALVQVVFGPPLQLSVTRGCYNGAPGASLEHMATSSPVILLYLCTWHSQCCYHLTVERQNASERIKYSWFYRKPFVLNWHRIARIYLGRNLAPFRVDDSKGCIQNRKPDWHANSPGERVVHWHYKLWNN